MNRNLGLEQAFQPAGYGDFPGARTNAGLKSPPTPQPGKAARQIAWCFFIALSQMMAADRASSERQIPPPGISIPPDARLELEEGCIHLAGAIALCLHSIGFCIWACRAAVIRSDVSCRCALEMGSVIFAAFNPS